MLISFRNKPFSFAFVGQFKHISKSGIENLKQSFILVFLKKLWPKGMTHAKPFPMVKIALYQNDVQFGDKRIPFKMVKCIQREF